MPWLVSCIIFHNCNNVEFVFWDYPFYVALVMLCFMWTPYVVKQYFHIFEKLGVLIFSNAGNYYNIQTCLKLIRARHSKWNIWSIVYCSLLMKRVLPVLMNKSFQICNKAFLFKGFQNSSEKRDSKQSKMEHLIQDLFLLIKWIILKKGKKNKRKLYLLYWWPNLTQV